MGEMGGIEQFFLGGNALPAMPEVARQLIASFDDDNVDLRTIVDLTQHEHWLALKVLRLAQSARYARARNIASLDEAGGLLGMERMRDLVLATSIAEAFPRVVGLDRIGFWKHAIATGGYARWLGIILGVDADSGYLAGLMLRSGQLLMARVLPQAIASVEASCAAPGTRMALERRLVGITHAEVTAELARRWQLPQRLVDGFAHASNPLDARPFSLLAAVLSTASVMADAGARAVAVGEALERANRPLLDHLRLDVPWLQAKAPTFEELTAPVDELLG
ncbi:MAG TPA: HDOD domain-containing protein [Burkholderiaceae bacterium]|nr:HDOD domain-containing protein [Burkholderiaceae bacterium]